MATMKLTAVALIAVAWLALWPGTAAADPREDDPAAAQLDPQRHVRAGEHRRDPVVAVAETRPDERRRRARHGAVALRAAAATGSERRTRVGHPHAPVAERQHDVVGLPGVRGDHDRRPARDPHLRRHGRRGERKCGRNDGHNG